MATRFRPTDRTAERTRKASDVLENSGERLGQPVLTRVEIERPWVAPEAIEEGFHSLPDSLTNVADSLTAMGLFLRHGV